MSHARSAAFSPEEAAIREQLVELLAGGHAHAPFDQAVRGFPVERSGIRPAGAPHSAWELLEHLRLSQNDILRFTRASDYAAPAWPEAYWPPHPAPASPDDWAESVSAFRRDRAAFEALVGDPARDLYRPIPGGEGQTLLREALVLADHNSYHIAQLILVRQLLGAWKE